MNDRRMMKAADAAAYLGMSRSKFAALVNDGTLPQAIRFGGLVVWDKRRLDDFIDGMSETSETPSGDWEGVLV
jgi:prophage regulatory protein